MSVQLLSEVIQEVRLAESATSLLRFRVFRVFRGENRSTYPELRFGIARVLGMSDQPDGEQSLL